LHIYFKLCSAALVEPHRYLNESIVDFRSNMLAPTQRRKGPQHTDSEEESEEEDEESE